MASLKERLAALRREAAKNNLTPAASLPRPARGGRAPLPPEARGWQKLAEYVFVREETFGVQPQTLHSIEAAVRFFLEGTPPEALLWYDTETTGLSGGAGTSIFLYGSGRLCGGKIKLRQLFLADFPGERDFLAAAAEDFERGGTVMLSYNGKAFDAPLLRGRFIMNRMARELPPQFDLLFTARRLWKDILPGCSLGVIEKHILGKTRSLDIPGRMIPDVYFDYLAGKPHVLPRVTSHHREDILSLVELFARYGKITENPSLAGEVHKAALGAMIEARFPGGGLAFIRDAASNGDEAALVWLSRHYKRRGDFDEAEKLWKALAEKSYFAALELAKHLEHRIHDYAGALALAEKLYARKARLASALSETLPKRIERLRKKLGRL
ncbi:MAG: ribonuclease H-like domain-containing protein [Spirochaetales bacterium]|nr:ribonuclease H-like domain-containing protein [Spirochaetales bacterium]